MATGTARRRQLLTLARQAARAGALAPRERGERLAALAAVMVELDAARGAQLAERALEALRGQRDAAVPRARALLAAAMAQVAAGDYRRAAALATRSAAGARAAAERPLLASAHCVAGVAERFLGRPQPARAHYRQALRYNRPADRALEAAIYHNLAGLAHFEGRGAVAERHARRALRLRRGGAADLVAIERAGLAAILHARGKWRAAARLYRVALAALTACLGRIDHEVAHCLGNYAALLHQRGAAAAARRSYLAALAIEERCLGPDHPEVACVLENLATLELEGGRLASAERHARRALALRARTAPKSADARACRELVALIERARCAQTSAPRPSVARRR